MDRPSYFDKQADLSIAIEEERGFIRDAVADGITGRGLMAQNGYAHRSLRDRGEHRLPWLASNHANANLVGGQPWLALQLRTSPQQRDS